MQFNAIKRKLNSIHLAIVVSVAFFVFCCFYFSVLYQPTAKSDEISGMEVGFDVLIRHYQSVNFAIYNKFPVIGYIGDPELYKIQWANLDTDDVTLPFFEKLMAENNAVYNFARPPLYPWIVGWIYKIFGFHPFHVQTFAIIILSFIAAFLPLTGFMLWGIKGLYSGIIASIIFVFYDCDTEFSHDKIDLLLQAILLVLLTTGATLKKNSSYFHYILFGVLFALHILLKPLVIFFPIFLIAFVLIVYKKANLKQLIPRLLTFLLANAIVLFPWFLYKSDTMIETERERTTWVSVVNAKLAIFSFKNFDELNDLLNSNSMQADTFKNVVYSHLLGDEILAKSLWENKFLLHQHNEQNIDGKAIHSEWQYIKNSFYLHPKVERKPVPEQLILFYLSNPSYIGALMLKKVSSISIVKPSFFWLALSLWGLMQTFLMSNSTKKKRLSPQSNTIIVILALISVYINLFDIFNLDYLAPTIAISLFAVGTVKLVQCKPDLTSLIYPSLIISLFLLTPLSFGAERFGDVFIPINVIIIIYSVHLLVELTWSNFKPNCINP